MAPIPLPIPTPNFPFSNIEDVVPPPPQDPPSIDDILLARKYAERALIAKRYPGQIDAQSTVDALVYSHSILSAASGGVTSPPWFAQALQLALNPINTRLDAMETHLETCLDAIETKVNKLTIFTAKNYNCTLADGRLVPFEPVPFPDGELPSENAETPTVLTSVTVLDELTYPELKAYCEGYYPGHVYHPGQCMQERRQSVREAIGCHPSY